MKNMLADWRKLSEAGVLGLNARNGDFIMRFNQRKRYPLVDDKVLCKKVLLEHGMPTPEQIGVISRNADSGKLAEYLHGIQEFVIKPANGSGGDGILVIAGLVKDLYRCVDGRLFDGQEVAHHLTNVISGLYSLGGQPDAALLEALVKFDPVFGQIAHQGVPDIRVIVFRGVPVMSMVRLPTRLSHGKANLHQGAIGAGICLSTGRTTGGVLGNQRVNEHIDTGASIVDFEIPHWNDILRMSSQCYDAIELGYLGVDIVLDRDRGPLILELNARPGLNIQIANRVGLRQRLERVVAADAASLDHTDRAAWARDNFSR
ncbi:MAG: alpha-L-glutamate ligase-like protein [Xanthomonadales bacterium]|nr:alpha-L-glutamate ligase-like protein [Xanthomonadales bacterium]